MNEELYVDLEEAMKGSITENDPELTQLLNEYGDIIDPVDEFVEGVE